MNRSFTIYRNNFVAVGGCIVYGGIPLGCLIGAILCLRADIKDIAIFLLLVAIMIFPFFLILLPSILVRVTLTDDGVYCKVPYKKVIKREYRNYPYILRGYYFHGTPMGSVGMWIDFIVLTNRRYSDAELYQINLVASDEDTIIIKNTARNRKRLCAILPPNMRNKFMCVFGKQ